MSNPVNKWDEELAKFATEAAAALPVVGGDFIGTSGGRLTFKGAAVPNNQMDVVILDFTRVNMLYEGVYDPNNPASPICYAFGNDPDTMKPHANSVKPQCASCKDCPMNAFGSANQGKGKACQNTMRLSMVPVGALEDLEHEDAAYMKVPVMSVKNFSGYAQQIAQTLKRPPFAMVTRISTVPDPKSQFRLTFDAVEQVDGDVIGAIMEKRKAVPIDFPFPDMQPAEEKPKPTGRFSGSAKLGRR